MIIVGLTGGIGSGKSTVAEMFTNLGVPVYIADAEAKNLSNTSKIIRSKIVELLGTEAYKNGTINTAYVSGKVFKNSELLKKLNGIIHPEVAKHFEKWVKKQKGSYCIKEAAILFETGSYRQCDMTILVKAPLEIRLKRVLDRDRTATKKGFFERMQNQWDDDEKEKLADLVIENIDLENTQRKVKEIHLFLLKKSNN